MARGVPNSCRRHTSTEWMRWTGTNKPWNMQLAWSFLDKDDFLEGLFPNSSAISPKERSALSRQADTLFEAEALKPTPAVITSWRRHPSSTSTSGTPTGWLQQAGHPLVEVHCHCDASRDPIDLRSQFQAGEVLAPPFFPDTALICPTAAPVSALDFQMLAQVARRLTSAPRGS